MASRRKRGPAAFRPRLADKDLGPVGFFLRTAGLLIGWSIRRTRVRKIFVETISLTNKIRGRLVGSLKTGTVKYLSPCSIAAGRSTPGDQEDFARRFFLTDSERKHRTLRFLFVSRKRLQWVVSGRPVVAAAKCGSIGPGDEYPVQVRQRIILVSIQISRSCVTKLCFDLRARVRMRHNQAG